MRLGARGMAPLVLEAAGNHILKIVEVS